MKNEGIQNYFKTRIVTSMFVKIFIKAYDHRMYFQTSQATNKSNDFILAKTVKAAAATYIRTKTRIEVTGNRKLFATHD